MDQVKEFIKQINSLSYKHHTWRTFQDFVEMSAISFMQAVDFDQQREEQYLDITKRYKKDEIEIFPKLLALVVEALEEKPQDFLGECFMQLNLGNHWKGQFFTPYYLCQFMAQVMIGNGIAEQIAEQGYIKFNEPACGAGATIIAFYDECRKKGIDTNQTVFTVAQDIDITAAYMCYIQLTLLDIPAQVIVGNTLTMEVHQTLNTLASRIYNWNWRLSQVREVSAEEIKMPFSQKANEEQKKPETQVAQLELFNI